MTDAQQLADEEAEVRALAAARNISGDPCDVVVGRGFSSLEALACLDADDLRKSKVPVGQQKLLLRCITRQLGGQANSGGLAQHSAPTDAIATEPTAGATDNTSGGGDDAFVRQLRDQLSAAHGITERERRGGVPTSHRVCCRGRIHKYTCRTSTPHALSGSACDMRKL